jgi:hypothetical protein
LARLSLTATYRGQAAILAWLECANLWSRPFFNLTVAYAARKEPQVQG